MQKRKILKNSLYVILDLDLPYLTKNPVCLAKELIGGGTDILQLRTKKYPAKYLIDIGVKIKKIAKKNNVIFIINDRVDIAKAIDADGVHLGQEDLPVNFARNFLGKEKIIGLSTHNISEIRKAQMEDIDYISIGPIFKSPTKPELKPIGIKILKKVTQISKLPVIAIGGINLNNLKEVLSYKINSVAIISAILKSNELKRTVYTFKNYLTQYGN